MVAKTRRPLLTSWGVLMLLGVALGVLLLAIQPVRAQEAPPTIPNAETVFSYAEKGEGPVTTYNARDPEGNKIFWTLSGTDAGVFSIDGGALRFKSPPDYENPRDEADATTTPPAIADNNIYRVTVRFGAGGEDGAPGADDYDGDDLGELDLTITVTNIDEEGKVNLSSLQPQVGTTLTATVTDLDGVAVTGSWQWANSDSMNGPWEDIAERSTDSTYRPVDTDLDKYLQVTVRYRDNVSGADTRTESAVSAYPVRKDSITSNDPPKFPDQSTLLTGVSSPTAAAPTQGRTTTERFIHENSPAGTRVGAPVTAFDDDTDIEVLTYSLSGHPDDVNSFNIDPVTGQITVSAAARLNADVAAGTRGAADTPYEISVIATDGDGDIQTIEVDIRVVRVDEPPRVTGGAREMSHWEVDRTVRTAWRIDTDLDSGVLDFSADPATLVAANYQDATYTATDQEDTDTDLTWSLAGPDATRVNADGDVVPIFVLTADATADPVVLSTSLTGATATLAFDPGPDFETPWDTNKDNVYEVTLVVTDSSGQKGEYPVTVKVINSTDDNVAGTVKILNRVPEVAIPLKATHNDRDGGVRELKWQWYRSVATATSYPTACPASTDGARYFIDTAADTIAAAWQAIPGATSATYRPGYDEDSGGTMSVTTDDATSRVVEWTGGDIDVTITTTKATADAAEFTAYTWENPRCLRAAVTYRDAIDRTHTEQDNPDTAVDETLEGAFVGSEFPVKRIDEENDAPVFTEGGVDGGPAVSTYTAERREDTTATSTATPPITIDITEAFAATDVMVGEDDDTANTAPTATEPNNPGPGPGADILTYSLSGADAKHFVIVGSVENPTSYDPDGDGPADAITDAGSLIITANLDFETKTRYTVTVTATDPSDDSDSVNVTVDLTNHNEPPTWVTTAPNSPAMVVYTENDTIDVGVYLAKDPEGAGISYALVDTAAGDVAATDIEDRALFSIDPLDGNLSFKSSPNYEKPGDQGPNNRYQVTVSATVVDDPPLTASTDPVGPHVIVREVTVVVDNVNEAPVFSETTDTLEIKENADDPEKEPPLAAGYEYLLNRGVGKPSANLPVAPNLDVGIPVPAVDDDSAGTFPVGGYTDTTTRDRIDGLTYTLSGTDAAHFHVVPATGQILTLEKLDYETKNEYKVTVTATDPMGESDSIDMTIEVTDVDEVPVPKVLVISGDASHTVEENSTDALGEYTVVAGGGATADSWMLEGPDASHFMLEGTGMSRSLKFASAPDYDAMADADGDNTYMVTVKVADSSDSANIFGTFAVTVDVTDTNELGTLTSPTIPATYAENGTDALGTYTVSGGTMDDMATWDLEGDDAGAFDITGGVLSFMAAPDYEAMADANGDNTYMVTVKVMAGGETEMSSGVTVMVTDINELGTLAGIASHTYAENGTGAVDTYTLSGGTMDSAADWSVEGADAGAFSISGGTLSFSASPDYEAMADADGDNTYMVTVMAEAGGEMETMDVTVMVTDVDELGTLIRPSIPATYMENGTDALGTYTLSGGTMDSTADWSVEGADAGAFSISGGMLSFSASPDYEAMADANADNTYMVMVKAMAGGEMAMMDVSVMVTDANDAPMFAHATGTRSIAENTDAGMDIGNPIVATDQDGDTLTYTLSGTDAASFDIGSATGQLMTKAALDYETKMSYMVTVTATDPEGATDTRDITINVTDIAVENLAPMFDEGATATRSVDENTAAGMNVGDPVTATDPDEGDKVAYTLGGSDEASFTINGSTGQLMTQAALDHETKDSYMVTVTAMDADSATDTIDVTINVNNVDETGTLELSSMSPIAGTALTATLTDLDGVVAVVDWQWSRSMTMGGTFEHIAEETMAYTPTDGDVGYYLQVVAKYTDGHGSGKSETARTGKVSAAPNPVLVKHDANENGRIDRDEAIAAVRSYQAGEISRSEVIQVLQLYRGN